MNSLILIAAVSSWRQPFRATLCSSRLLVESAYSRHPFATVAPPVETFAPRGGKSRGDVPRLATAATR